MEIELTTYPAMNKEIVRILRTTPESVYALYAAQLIEEQAEQIERLQSQLKELKKKQRWIPVSERLPEEDKEVWAALKVGTAPHDYQTWYRMLKYSSFFGWHVYTSEVTHWMEPPELPEEE